jgi:hypothetical protein
MNSTRSPDGARQHQPHTAAVQRRPKRCCSGKGPPRTPNGCWKLRLRAPRLYSRTPATVATRAMPGEGSATSTTAGLRGGAPSAPSALRDAVPLLLASCTGGWRGWLASHMQALPDAQPHSTWVPTAATAVMRSPPDSDANGTPCQARHRALHALRSACEWGWIERPGVTAAQWSGSAAANSPSPHPTHKYIHT